MFIILTVIFMLVFILLNPKQETFATDDVLIVGAGAAGLYTAYKLKQAGITSYVYEATDRIGGRDFDVKLSSVVLPEGAMRILPYHKYVLEIAKELDIEIIPFNEKDLGMYARGSFQSQFNLRKNEQGLSAQELERLVMDGVENHPENAWIGKDIAYEDKIKLYKYNGVQLYEYNWVELCTQFLSSEAIDYIKIRNGYWSEYILNNAANMFLVLRQDRTIFNVPKGGSGMSQPKGGMMTIPLKLAERYKQMGGRVALNHKLVRVIKNKGRYIAEFENGQKVSTDRLVLTMGPSELKRIQFVDINTSKIDHILNSLEVYDAVKGFLEYNKKWWKYDYGRIVTDLPIQQVLFWNSSPPVLLFYCDGNHAKQIGNSIETSNEPKRKEDDTYTQRLSNQTVRYVTTQLSEMFDGVTPPSNTTAKYWRDAWSIWKPGYKYWESIEYAKEPADKIHIAGVNYSIEQGWMNGAFNSAEAVIHSIIRGI